MYSRIFFLAAISASSACVESLATESRHSESESVLLWLADSQNDELIRPLDSGEIIDIAVEGTDLTIVAAHAFSTVPGSAVFSIDGEHVRTENVEPFALGGDTNGDFRRWSVSPGNHWLVVDLYFGDQGTGGLLATRAIQIEVVGGP
jgi:hypothetical protein